MKLKNIEDIYELSALQKGMLFHSVSEPGSGVYFQQLQCILGGTLDIEAFEQAWQQAVNRHPVLRTTFFWEGLAKPMQVVRQSARIKVETADWSELAEEEQRAHLRQLLDTDRRRGFELTRAPLMRLALLRLGPDRHLLVWSHHHLLLDGWSMPLLLKEVFLHYEALRRGTSVELERPRPYRDYIAWLQRQPLEQAEQFWRRRLKGFTAPTPLAVRRGGAGVQELSESSEVSSSGASEDGYAERRVRLSRELTEAVTDAARSQQLTLNTMVQGAWALLLARYSGESDVVFGATVSGRPAELAGVEQMLGLFINTLPVRARIEEAESVGRWLRRLQAEGAEAREYEHSPLVEVTGWSDLPRGTPLFESVLAFENFPVDSTLIEQVKQRTGLEISEFSSQERGDQPLALVVFPDRELMLQMEYQQERFDDRMIRRMLGHVERLLTAIASEPEQRVGDLPLLTNAESRQLLAAWNDPTADFSRDRCLHELFESRAESAPTSIAVAYEGQQLSYRQLNERANRLARHLCSLGVGPEVRVGIMVERSLEMVVAMLGVLKAGGAYVPLDPAYPAERLRFMLEDLGVSVLVTEQRLAERASDKIAQVVCIDSEWTDLSQCDENVTSNVTTDNLAYIIYTSGSTGRPKGVLITHSSLVSYVSVISREFGLTADDGFAQIASASFDVAVEEIFPALVSGARVILCRDIPYAKDFLPLIVRDRLTAFELPTAFWNEWVYELSRSGEQLPECVRLVVVGGEKNLPDRYAAWRRLAGGRISLIHVYGLTETTVTSTTYQPAEENAEQDIKQPLPIGRPLPNTQICILDAQLRLAPPGVAGELYIGGSGVARGYHNRPELTAERFVPDPFSRSAGERLYRTGDLARYLEDGNIEFLRRIDEQVKVRGYRIEPAEIEAILAEHPAVRDVVVAVREDAPGQKRLVAYVTPGAGHAVAPNGLRRVDPGKVVSADNGQVQADLPISFSDLRAYLGTKLPDYMVPSTFAALEALPLTPNGKIDRGALPAPDFINPAPNGTRGVASSAAEQTLATIWADVLGLPEVGVTDNFFELGGDSILCIQVVARANQAGLRLSPKHLFEYQTVAELASAAAEMAVATPASAPVKVTREEGIRDVPLTPIQRWFFAQDFDQLHHWNQSILLETRRPLRRAALGHVFTALVRRHAALRLRFERDGRGVWRQRLLAAGTAVDGRTPVHELDLTLVGEGVKARLLERCCAQAQQSLDLADGPLLRFVLFSLDEQGGQRLLGVAHHLVIDAVSWRVLLGELQDSYERALTGAAVQPEGEVGSFTIWADRLTAYGESDELAAQEPHWRAAERVAHEFSLPLDKNGSEATDNTGASVAELTVSLTGEETNALLREVPRAYRSRIQDALLAALGRALNLWTGRRPMAVWVEGHGREQLGEAEIAPMPEVAGAVGWFTALYPVAFEAEWDDEEAALKATKEALRSVPDGGVGYGLWKYAGGAERNGDGWGSERDGVAFNYLGQLDQALEESPLFTLASESSGPASSPLAARGFLLEINGAIVSGRLQLTWNYSQRVHHRETIERVAADYIESLRKIIKHCRLPDSRGFTPSDFPGARLDQEELDELARGGQRIEDIQPLSPMQKGMLFHSLYSPKSGEYVAQFIMTLHGDLDPFAFEQAWRKVVQRHSILRTDFICKRRDEPLQIVREQVSLPWEQQDWRELKSAKQEERLQAYLQSDRRRGFELTRAPLLRLLLIRTSGETYRLVWTLAMMLLDGWSVPLLLKEVFLHYEALRRGTSVELERPRPYRDYIAWLQRQSLEQAEQFWRRRLKGFAAPTTFAVDHPAASNREVAGLGKQEVRLSRELTGALADAARSQQLTLNTMVQGAWALLLARYSGESDVVFGATVSGRPAELAGVEQMLGLFINTLPVRARIEEAESVGRWLRRLQAEGAEAREYEHSPLVEVTGWSDLPRGTPLFESLLVFDNYPFDTSLAEQVKQRTDLEVELRVLEQTNFPLMVTISPADELGMKIDYERSRFDEETIGRMLGGHFERLLAAMASDFEQRVDNLPMLTDEEQHRLLVEWNDTRADFPRELCLHELFEAQVERTPDTVAVVFEGERLTYAELNCRANRLAHHLRGIGVEEESLVGVLMERSPEMVVALLGTLKAGGAYVPFDPDYPQDRLSFMLEDASVRVLLTQEHLLPSLPEQDVPVLCLDSAWAIVAAQPAEKPRCLTRPDNAAYIIYTSGSTGRPKGVVNTHGGISNRLVWMQEAYRLTESDRVMQKTPFSFDVSVWEFFWPLMYGACLVMASPKGHHDSAYLAQLIKEEGITTLHFVPSMLQAFVDEPGLEEKCTTLRQVICSGEALPIELQERFYARFDHTALHNLYGPTEAAVDVTFWLCARESRTRIVPIGRPIANTQIYILDARLRPVPVGVAGELHIGGSGLARGYLGRPELTAEKFIPDPFGMVAGARLYRTGDLARYLPDGNLEYLGRLDHQVKIRGFRIELGEIETALGQHPSVRDVVVLAREDPPGDQRLVAYLVAEYQAAPAVEDLRRLLREKLPSYMLPSAFVMLAAFPLTPNGKVDRRALPPPDQARPELEQSFIAPRGPVEEAVAGIWAEVLQIEKVGVRDNFFSLGGHSLLAMQVVNRVRDSFQVDLPLRLFFEAPPVVDFAAAVVAATQTGAGNGSLLPPEATSPSQEQPQEQTK